MSHFCAWQNSAATVEFLDRVKAWKEQLSKKLNDTRPLLLVWDNVRWHKSKEVKQWLRNNPHVLELMNFPPYSPELNPQERVWKALKRYMTDILVYNQFDDAVTYARAFLRTRRFRYKFV
jgi:transposase